MAVPKYHEMMLPILRLVSDQAQHSMSDITEQLAVIFKLSAEDRKEPLPSGGQYKFENRVGWARTYLKKAGLLESPDRGIIKITARGTMFMRSNSSPIRSRDLMQFEEFRQFKKRTDTLDESETNASDSDETPEETIEKNIAALRSGLATELLDKVKNSSPKFFERLVIELLLKMGYGGSRKDAGRAVGKSHDGGIDGIINEDKLGLDVIYIQAKRWESTVGRKVVAEFVGSLEQHHAQRGIIITTSSYSKDAEESVKSISKKIVLIDGERLASLMIENDIGVTAVQTYSLKRVDSDFFSED